MCTNMYNICVECNYTLYRLSMSRKCDDKWFSMSYVCKQTHTQWLSTNLHFSGSSSMRLLCNCSVSHKDVNRTVWCCLYFLAATCDYYVARSRAYWRGICVCVCVYASDSIWKMQWYPTAHNQFCMLVWWLRESHVAYIVYVCCVIFTKF